MSMINENIIIRFLSGQATEKEAQEILRWKNNNEENKRTFREIEVAYNTSEIVMNPEKFDAPAAYPKILSKLKGNKVIFIRNNRLKQFAGYAATAVIAIGLTWGIQKYFLIGNESWQTAQTIYQSVETPAGAKSLVTLEDGTKIWLNAKSKLKYPTHFVNDQREVQLEGEGYFDVAKDKSRPFKVKTSDLSINVLGTVFNLKSYSEEGLIETTLIEGKIVLNKLTGGNKEKKILELEPSQQATFIKKEGFLLKDEAVAADIPSNEINHRSKDKLIVTKNVDTYAITAWTDNKIIFKNETFESIAVRLERRYGAKITFEDEVVKGYRFSGIFEEISINQALKALQFASAFNFRIEQDKIYIHK